MTTVVRVSPAQLQTESLVTIRVDEIDYHFTLGRVQSWNHDMEPVVTLANKGGEWWIPWPPPHGPIRWSGLACGEFVFCLEDATDEAIVAAKAGKPEFIYYR